MAKQQGTAFADPLGPKCISKVYPKGTTWKKNKDGTISPIKPKKSSPKKK